jgi:hypothetical protein
MTKLSPASQAVKDAVLALYPDKATQEIGWPLDIPTIAAAIRTAADQLFKTEVLPPGYAYSAPAEAWHYEFQLNAHRKLCAIAAELKISATENQ